MAIESPAHGLKKRHFAANFSLAPAGDFLHNGLSMRERGTANSDCQSNSSDLSGDLIAVLEDELRIVAQSLLATERPNHTLQPTALINELWLRMASSNGSRARFQSPEAFMAYASKAIRHILIDHARRRAAAKRGGGVEIHNGVCDATTGDPDSPLWDCSMLDLEEEINLLEKSEIRCAQVFEMRFFGGMSNQQIARWLDLPERTVRNDWNFARAWLASRLRPRSTPQDESHGNTDT